MDRGVSPVLGTLVLVGLTVILAVTVGVALSTPELGTTPTVSLTIVVDADTNTLFVQHRGGDTLDVTELDLEIYIEGEELAEQPPIPFFAADGFESGPTGPFNVESDNEWTAGESASLALAGTNDPEFHEGATIRVIIATETTTIVDTTKRAT